MNRKASIVLGIIGLVAFSIAIVLGMSSCYSEEKLERQEILLSFPEISSMTVGQTHPFSVGLNLPAEGIESMSAQSVSGNFMVRPESQLLSKGQDNLVFNLKALRPGDDKIMFCLDQLLCETLPVRVFTQPE